MKPLSVLLLVLAAVGVLFFAITKLPGGEEDQTSGLEADRGTPGALAPETRPAGGALPDPGPSGRDSVAVEPAPANARTADPISSGWQNQLVGLVKDEQGQPVAEAEVVLTRSSPEAQFFINTELDRSGDRTIRTTAEGRFSFENVEPYDYYALKVDHPAYSRKQVENVRVGMKGVFEEPVVVLTKGAVLHGIVRAQDGGGIAGATLYLDSMFFQAQGEPAPDRLTAETDALGSFVFENVPTGHRSMHVSADGFANALINGLNFRDGDDIERDVTLDVAEMICGIVVGDGNQPVSDAEVLALSFSNSNQQCRDSVRTGEDGRFCLEHLAPGSYTVAVRADGYAAANQRRVQAGEANLVIEMKAQARVSGKVVDAATGKPIPRFSCTLRQTFQGVEATTPTSIAGSFQSAEGTFDLNNVPAGTYLVEAVAPGYAPGFSEGFRIAQNGQGQGGLLIRLGQGGQISGIVLGPDGAPIERAKVTTHPNDWTASEFDRALGNMLPSNVTVSEALTDAAGRFTLKNLKPERYQVRVVGAGLCEYVQADIDVPDGGVRELGSIELIGGGRIEGTVLDQAGRPIPGARILARLDSRTGQTPRFYQAKAGTDGRYVVDGVYPGSYVVQAQPPAGADFLDELTARSAQRTVSVADGQSSTAELKLGT